MSQLEEDRWPGQVQPDASGGEPCGAGVAAGGAEPAPQPGGAGRVPAADEGAAGGSGGRDRDGAQAGPDRLPGAEARDDVRASESGGVRGPSEGEADQGAEAEGPPVGAGGRREAVGQRCAGGRRAGAGVTKGKRVSEVVGRRAAARNRGERRRTARQTGPWPWQDSVRAEENCGGRSPRCAGYAIAGRFLATSASNASTE